MSVFEKQNAMAREILTKHRGKVLAIMKATRAGATTSLLKAACELGQKTVIVAPYIKIFDLTVEDVAQLVETRKPRIARIFANREICEKVKAGIKKHPALGDLPFHYRPPCKNCEFNDPSSCRLQEILNDDYDILGLTYAKLRADWTSESETASAILEKLKLADNLILDEFVTGIVSTAPSVTVEDPYSYLDRELSLFKNGPIKSISEAEAKVREKIPDLAIALNSIGNRLREGKHEICDNPLSVEDRNFFDDNFAKCWQVIERLTRERKDTKLLQQIIQILPSERFLVQRKEDKIRVTPVEELEERSLRGSSYLRGFLSKYYSNDKLIALVDACLPDLDLKEILSVPVETFSWGDPLDTNRSQLIICDTRKFGVINFFRDDKLLSNLKQLINFAARIHKSSTILIITLNKNMNHAVKNWQKTGEIPRDITVTYYRSEFSRGITIDPNNRIMILIGGPYLPKIAYLAETYGLEDKAVAMQSAFKRSDMRSAFINLIGRVKDPRGKEKSVVYATGITVAEVRAFVGQKDVSPPLIARFPVQGADALDFEILANCFLHAHELRARWANPEEDLPILARILRICEYRKKTVLVSDVIPSQTKRVQQFIDNYSDVLTKFAIKVVKTARGTRLEPSKS